MVDLTKPVQTRDGRKARVICTDAQHPQLPVTVLVRYQDGYEYPRSYTRAGRYRVEEESSGFDLINIPEREEVWVNFYGSEAVINAHSSRKHADYAASGGRLARLRVTIEDGKPIAVTLEPIDSEQE